MSIRCVVIAFIVAVASWGTSAVSAPLSAGRVTDEPITPVPQAQPAVESRIALGERLFSDVRLSGDNSRSCNTCHNLSDNGATRAVVDVALDGSPLKFNTTS